ncbi:ATP-binding cassette domain-containing protein [Alicyclobacillus macrosporangiidus]|jgi:ABC-2 type transport system ATP-binding protein|uniref:ABC-2 type transport system ATP-binding protein n=1 Tax=Alicyclobacillus macrosporangiidus TaxID=392015 RepID=A0A1I7HXY7_9BACL|nr:ATP-binding cassette domain-containing protein [Alicyclobacillus macrosporangiidus]SFU65550.1 ABC-2 type transport system ATP-binding protein [Alicyclobacillus macrosporangiidus]
MSQGDHPPMSDSVVVEGLSKRFGAYQAVDDVSFRTQAGECFGLLGPNGAGKSTTIKMLATLLRPDAGRALVAGFDVVAEPQRVRSAIGYVPQMLSVNSALTGYENLVICARLQGLRPRARKVRIDEVITMLGLEDAAHRLVRTYSGGMVRRLEIGQAILHRPKVLFLDEPTVGLDPVARQSVWEHIERLRRDYGMTVFLTTHYMEEAESLCSRIAIMSRGRVAALGTLAELRDRVGNPEATLNEIFVHFAGQFQHEGGLRDVSRTRRIARRLG